VIGGMFGPVIGTLSSIGDTYQLRASTALLLAVIAAWPLLVGIVMGVLFDEQGRIAAPIILSTVAVFSVLGFMKVPGFRDSQVGSVIATVLNLFLTIPTVFVGELGGERIKRKWKARAHNA
jgi:hypothetical protein